MARIARQLRVIVGFASLFGAVLILGSTLAARAEAFVYWTGGDEQIGRANLDGTGADESFFAAGSSSAAGVAVDATHIYWSNQDADTIGRAKLDGKGMDEKFIVGADVPSGVAVDGAHIYWANQSADTIGRANLDGTNVDQSFITVPYVPSGVAVDDAHVYFTNQLTGGIGRANLDGTNADQSFIAVPGAYFLTDVAVDDAHVYWVNQDEDAGTIGRADLDGTGVEESFIAVDGSPLGVAVDGAHVYWANNTLTGQVGPIGPIGRANLDGTGIEQSFIRDALFPWDVAVDALRSFSFGKVSRNKRKGTAKLTVKVPGPGDLELAKTKLLKGAKKSANAAGKIRLQVRPRGKAKEKLEETARANVRAKVAYSPSGPDPNIVAGTGSKKLRLVKRG